MLAHDLNGQQAQALVRVREAAGSIAQLLFTALCLPGTTDGDDAASLTAFAVRQWGTRMVQRADEVARWDACSMRAEATGCSCVRR